MNPEGLKREPIFYAILSLRIAIGSVVVLWAIFAAGVILLAPSRDRMASGLVIAGILFVVLTPVVAFGFAILGGLSRRARWAWFAACALFVLFLPSFFLPLGALGLWGLARSPPPPRS